MRANLTLVRDTGAAAPEPPVPPRNLVPVIDPIRDAALEASLNPDAVSAMDDAIGSALQHLHRDNGATPLAGLFKDVWRTAFAEGYRAAHMGQAEVDFAEAALAAVIALDAHRSGGDPA